MLWSQLTPDVMPAVQRQFNLPSDVVAIEYNPLPFFKNGGLLKLQFGPGDCYYAGISIGGDQVEDTIAVIPMYGRGQELYVARISAGIYLPTETEALEWVKFFSSHLTYDGDRFIILDDLEGKSVECDEPFEFYPPQCSLDPAIPNQFNIECFVEFGRLLFKASYIVEPDGRVDMVEDTEIGVLHTAH